MSQQPTPNILEIEEAFKEVFPEENLRDVEFVSEEERTVLTLHSDIRPLRAIKTRTYAHQPGQSYKELFEKTPHLD